jgi:Mn-containing catalase
MQQVKDLLIGDLEELLHAETLLTGALPKMVKAAHNPSLKEAFEKHLGQTDRHVERVRKSLELLGELELLEEKAQPEECKSMMGLISESEETIREGKFKQPVAADLALIAAAQKLEHYEIAGYRTVHAFARQIGEFEVAALLAKTLAEEESADYLFRTLSRPLLEQASLDAIGARVNLEIVAAPSEPRRQKASRERQRAGSPARVFNDTSP